MACSANWKTLGGTYLLLGVMGCLLLIHVGGMIITIIMIIMIVMIVMIIMIIMIIMIYWDY